MTIAIIGGTGPEGRGLAVRWCVAGEIVVIGSRLRDRAHAAAEAVRAIVPSASVSGETNEDAAYAADVIVVSVPYEVVAATLPPLASAIGGKLVVSVVAAIDFANGRPKPLLPPGGSIAQEIQELMPTARVTAGFHTLSAEKLADSAAVLNEDTIICGDDADARHEIMDLARKLGGVRPVSGGRLINSIYPELAVGMLAGLNRIHRTHTGLRIVGLRHENGA
ncbi:MAG TPA: NADPH-dependent F420 reductase [Chloroflexota bacterium]|jgi:hypothetical protein|nr:NADPH-dependent F420 reductase [Chloroflexota bacterium]